MSHEQNGAFSRDFSCCLMALLPVPHQAALRKERLKSVKSLQAQI